MPQPAPFLSSWQVVAIFLGTMGCSAISIMIPFYLISRSDRLIDIFARGSSIYLRFITVILVVWSASVLAMQGRMDEGPSAIFGMIVGYVFGAAIRSPVAPNASESDKPG